MPKLPPLRLAVACVLIVTANCHALYAENNLERLKSNTERWIEIRNRLAKEQTSWKADREILNTSIETLRSSQESLQSSVAFHKAEIRKLEEQTQIALDRRKGFEQTNELLAERIGAFEARIKFLATRLPDPLKDRIQSLLIKITSQRDDLVNPLPNRLQNVVAIMTVIDEFNNAVTLSHAIKKLDTGDVIDVRVLYWGITTGYAINATGSKAWLLTPEEDGWKWTPRDDSAVQIKEMFAIYDKRIDPKIVQAPIELAMKEAQQ